MFKYDNCLERSYDNERRNITSVEFDIGRYGDVKETFRFDNPMTEDEVITMIETYLSEPLTEAHYERVKHDLFVAMQGKDLHYVSQHYQTKGDCLSDAIFLERVYIKNGKMTMSIGS